MKLYYIYYLKNSDFTTDKSVLCRKRGKQYIKLNMTYYKRYHKEMTDITVLKRMIIDII